MEIAVLLLLISQLATLPNPQTELNIIRQDIQRVNPALRSQVRYMTSYAVPQKNARVRFVQIDEYGSVVRGVVDNQIEPLTTDATITYSQLASLVASFSLNSLSLRGDVAVPEAVPGTDGRIIRYYLGNYGILPSDWERYCANEPYFRHLYVNDIYREIGTYIPLVRTDWFLGTAFYEPNYSKLLYSGAKIPKNEKEFLSFFGFNIQDSRKYEKDKGAIVDGFASQVSYNKRKLQRYQDTLGYLYRTNDFSDNVDKIAKRRINGKTQEVILLRNPSENLLVSSSPHIIFDVDASELIVQLPNGLQGYALLNKQRKIVADADIRIVRDTKNLFNDPRVVTGASCIWCHGNGINVPGNNNFATLGPNQVGDLHSYSPEIIRFLKRFYGSNFSKLVRDDQSQYIDAVGRCNRLIAIDNAEGFRTLVQTYKYQHITAQQAALELGVTVNRLHIAVKASRSKDLIDLFAKKPIPMPRAIWENQYKAMLVLLKGTSHAKN